MGSKAKGANEKCHRNMWGRRLVIGCIIISFWGDPDWRF